MVDKGDTLWPGERLLPGEQLSSPNKRCCLQMQDDGNLVLYVQNESGEWKPKFSSETGGPNIWCIMRGDGNLVIYQAGSPDWVGVAYHDVPGQIVGLWDAGTNGKPGAYLKMLDSGDACIMGDIMGILWHRGMTPW